MLERITKFIPENTKHTLLMRAFGLTKVPLLFLCSPQIRLLNEERCEVVFPFRKIVKNHLGSLYFGALAIGADTCVGMLAFDKIKKSKKNINLVFKDFKIDFLKRAEGETLFVCDGGREIGLMIDEVIASGERVNKTIHGQALVAGLVVAEFDLTLSLKLK